MGGGTPENHIPPAAAWNAVAAVFGRFTESVRTVDSVGRTESVSAIVGWVRETPEQPPRVSD